MKQMSSQELRNAWLNFYKERGHIDIGAVSLIGDGTTGVMFNVAGMQPLMPYLLGEKHPLGTRLCNIQGCVRTNDIESVGDTSHGTFFEMMGSWSLGDYFKEERTKWSYELLTQVFELPKDRLATTVFAGNDLVPKDEETAHFREKSGFLKENIYYLPKEDNWWEIDMGPNGRGPCGPDSEMFYITDKEPCSPNCNPSCSCGKYIEIGNDVFMQYNRVDTSKYVQLASKNVDTGWGFERILAFLNTPDGDVYKTDIYEGAIKILENASKKTYGKEKTSTRSMRIIADHIRTSMMLLGDVNHLTPSNVGAGYILRRLIRRAVVQAKKLDISVNIFVSIINNFIDNVYGEVYPNLIASREFIITEMNKEITKFENTLNSGLKDFNRTILNVLKNNQTMLSGQDAFKLYDTYGFPIELTEELAEEKGVSVDIESFKAKFKEHQEISRASIQKFKGGLASSGEMETKYHTATHLLNAALKEIVSKDIHQMGSNITSERLRFDFNCDHPLTEEEKKNVEDLVNKWIQEGLEVTSENMSKGVALKSGAECMFIERYPDDVTVYSIGNVSKELCGGPHVKNTRELGKFKIVKEQSSSSGVRRIKAILEGINENN